MSRGGAIQVLDTMRREQKDSPEAKERERREANRFGGGGWSGHKDYMADKNDKLRHQFDGKVDVLSTALSGVLLHINGETAVPKHELQDMVTQHGGQYAQYPSSAVTHHVFDHVADAKVQPMLTHIPCPRTNRVHTL